MKKCENPNGKERWKDKMSMNLNILPLVFTGRGIDYSKLNLKNIKSIFSAQATSTFT